MNKTVKFTLIYFSSYSPYLNLIEQIWRQIKIKIKHLGVRIFF
ncbi:MAG: transposase [Methanobrevibacter sp.]|nr:transposase [Methanobrevibacter sp.]